MYYFTLNSVQTHTAVHNRCTTSHWTVSKHILLFTIAVLLHAEVFKHTLLFTIAVLLHLEQCSNTYCCSQLLYYFTLNSVQTHTAVHNRCTTSPWTVFKHILLFTIAVLLHTEQCSNTYCCSQSLYYFTLNSVQTHTAVHNRCTTSPWTVFKHILLFTIAVLLHLEQCSNTYCCSQSLYYFTLNSVQTHTAVHNHCPTSHWSNTYCCSQALPYFTLVKHILLFTSTALLHTGQTHTTVHKHWSNTYCCSVALPYFTLVKHILLFNSTALLHTGQTHTTVHKHCTTSHWSNTYYCSQALPYFTLVKHILLFTSTSQTHTAVQ